MLFCLGSAASMQDIAVKTIWYCMKVGVAMQVWNYML